MLSSFGIDGNYSFSLQAIDVGRFSVSDIGVD